MAKDSKQNTKNNIKIDYQKELTQEYKRELRNLKSRISYANKRYGLSIDFDITPPDKITKQSVRNVKAIRGETLLAYADPEVQRGSDLGMQVITEIRATLASFDESAFRSAMHREKKRNLTNTLSDRFEDVIQAEGYETVSKRLENEKGHLDKLTRHLMYGSDSDIQEDLNVGEWLATIYGKPLSATEQMDVSDIIAESNLAYDLAYGEIEEEED